jgi:hypothetical protein
LEPKTLSNMLLLYQLTFTTPLGRLIDHDGFSSMVLMALARLISQLARNVLEWCCDMKDVSKCVSLRIDSATNTNRVPTSYSETLIYMLNTSPPPSQCER